MPRKSQEAHSTIRNRHPSLRSRQNGDRDWPRCGRRDPPLETRDKKGYALVPGAKREISIPIKRLGRRHPVLRRAPVLQDPDALIFLVSFKIFFFSLVVSSRGSFCVFFPLSLLFPQGQKKILEEFLAKFWNFEELCLDMSSVAAAFAAIALWLKPASKLDSEGVSAPAPKSASTKAASAPAKVRKR